MPEPRLAAAAIATRGVYPDIEVLLVERSPQLRFFGGYWAFPGGSITEIDCPQDDDSLEAAYRCALRELFEETGLLSPALRRNFHADRIVEFRHSLAVNAGLWRSLIDSSADAVSSVSRVCQFTTPEIFPVRYATQFVHVLLDHEQAPLADQREIVSARFFRPDDAIRSWELGEMPIAPPIVLLLQALKGRDIPSFVNKAIAAASANEQGRLEDVWFSPGILTAPLRTPTLPPATTTNTLIVGRERLYVIDPATPEASEQQRLFAKMDELITGGGRFEAILLTHHHEDHVGAVNHTSRRYELPVRAHLLSYDRIPAGYLRGEALNEGDMIPLGNSPDGRPGWHLEVIHTPGHAVDHLCFLDSRYHAIIAGDMLSTLSTILIDPPEGHMRTYIKSLERLLELPITTLYPAHGAPHRDGRALIREYLTHRRERECQTLGALSAIPRSLEDLVPRVYTDVPESVYPLAARSLLAELIKLKEDGRCEETGSGWRFKA